MAGIGASPLVFVSLLLLAISSPGARATFFTLPGNGLSVSGQLCCTQNGNCPGAGVAGAVVSLRCSNFFITTRVVGQNITDVNGFFNITVPIAPGSLVGLFGSIPCEADVHLPVGGAACPALSNSNGVLNGILQATGTFVTQVLGLVQSAQVVFFIRLL